MTPLTIGILGIIHTACPIGDPVAGRTVMGVVFSLEPVWVNANSSE
jgi:hypothetical protein